MKGAFPMFARSIVRLAIAAAASTVAACGHSSVTSPDYTPGYALSGTLAAAVDGVGQSNTHTFLLSNASALSVTLTAAVETLSDGTTDATVELSLGVGQMSNGACVATAATTTAAGTNAQLMTSLGAGTACVVVTDPGALEGSVAYTITIATS
jgi:hypothetical protein